MVRTGKGEGVLIVTLITIVVSFALLSGAFFIGYKMGLRVLESDEEATEDTDAPQSPSPLKVIFRSEEQEANLERIMEEKVNESLDGMTNG